MNIERTPIAWIGHEVAIAKAKAEKIDPNSESYVRYTARQEALEQVAVIIDQHVSDWILNKIAEAETNMDRGAESINLPMVAEHYGRSCALEAVMSQLGIPHNPEDSQ